MPLASVSFDNGQAAKIFADTFGGSRCGSHQIGYLGKHMRGSCSECSYLDITDKGEEDDVSNTGELFIDEMEVVDANIFDDGQAHEAPDQADPVGGSKAIWRDNLFAKSDHISFSDLVKRALAEGMGLEFAGSHMRTFDIRDACWMFLLDKARADGNPWEIANMLPKFCSEVSDERLAARLQYCTEASKRLPPGESEPRLHSLSVLLVRCDSISRLTL